MSDPNQPPPPSPEGGAPHESSQPGYTPPPPGYQAPPPGYQAPPPPMQAPTGVGQPADLLMRFLARLIDFIIIGIVTGIITGIIVAATVSTGGAGFYLGTAGSYAARAISAVLTAVIYLGYFVLMESRNGQTLGKMLLKLQTQGPGGGKPTMEQALRRNFWVALGILGLIPVVGGLLGSLAELVIVIVIAVTINNSPTRQGWHDNLAGGTRVIKIG